MFKFIYIFYMQWYSEYASCFSRKNAASEGCACVADMEVENVEELFVSLQLEEDLKLSCIETTPTLDVNLGELWYPSQL